MSTVYVVVTLLTVAANCFAATGDFLRLRFVLDNAKKANVPESWFPALGALKAAGAAGLLLGLFGVPLIGTAAAAGLVMFFVGAVCAHLRARYYSLGFPLAFLLLAVAVFVLDLTGNGV